MIDELSIRDLGVIEAATLPFGAGFTAVTGETGAGKTMVVTALGLLLGERADSGSVRSGAPQAVVEGRWTVADPGPVADRVREAGGDLDAAGAGLGELVLSRTLTAEGRSRAAAGGRGAPAAVLSELGEQLVVVHGQADQQRLRSPAAQREALDRFAGPDFAAALGEYRAVFRRWQEARAELDILTAERDRRSREAEELRAALDEIAAVDPQPGEDEELAARAERLGNLEDLRLAASDAQESISAQLSDDAGDAIARVEHARRTLDRVVAHDPQLAPIIATLHDAAAVLQDASHAISGYLAGLDSDGGRELEELQERRAALGQLMRRYGPTLDDVLERYQRGGSRLIELDGDDDRIGRLTAQVAADAAEVARRASDLTARRRDAGERLGAAVTAELGALAMPDAVLAVEVEPRETGASAYSAHGADSVSILLRPHPGAEPRPVGKGASGGELSRVMLAIEVVLAGTDPVPTLVFDEIDAGVGGAAAIEIGRRLARLAEHAQVIVVTHLAQVAAFASNHLAVVKQSDGTFTASSVRQLDGDERVAEMARLLSGLATSESALAHARELLDLPR